MGRTALGNSLSRPQVGDICDVLEAFVEEGLQPRAQVCRRVRCEV